jgi:hypothetical protein
MCVFATAMPASAARPIASPIPVQSLGVSVSAPEFLAHSMLADSWSWGQFWKFWKRQLDKTSGIVGVVLLVGLGAMLLIITKARR